MAAIVVYAPADPDVAGRVTIYDSSAHTPDYDAEPNKLENPNLAAVANVPWSHWKVAAGAVAEMTVSEKALIKRPEVNYAAALRGARLRYVNASTVSIGTTGDHSYAASSYHVASLEWSDLLTASLASSGAGGLDTGSEATSTWYAVHVIGDKAGNNAPAAMLSLSATVPTLPIGYDVFRRVGWVRNRSNGNLLRFCQTGNGLDRWIDWDASDGQYVISGGSANSWTPVSTASYVPSTANFIRIVFYLDTGVAGGDNYLNIRRSGGSGDYHDYYSPGVATNGDYFTLAATAYVDDSQSLDYAISPVDGSVYISIRGYQDQL